MNEEQLQQLLDFSKTTDKQSVFDHANNIAKELLLNWQIRSESESLHTLEALEFYLIIPNLFEDDRKKEVNGKRGATHKRMEQLESGTFYVHTKSAASWTLPIFNRQGIDITCGNKSKDIYGGILIRHVGGINNKDGSGRALRVILRGDSGHAPIPRSSDKFGWSNTEKEVLKKLNGANIFSNQTGIRLIRRPSNQSTREVLSEKRIGIEGTIYADERLRFFLK